MTGLLTGQAPAALWWGVAAALILAMLLFFWQPLRALGRLAARTGVGMAVLAAFSPLGALLGIPLGVNLLNGVVLGVLGAPGFGLLLMLNWVL